ncbi:MAG: 3-hydroxyacyl-CoA dehydrogenase [Planctomycetes bacterium]|nr:3-hydroxyacyl-CoA dehydrogenase [Planctomycetota bacterium]
MAYIYKVGIAGAGLMGSGIAQAVSAAGLPVVVRDVSGELVQRGLQAIRKGFEGRVKKGKMTAEQLEQKMALVSGSTSLADFSDADLVIEAVPEDLALKKRVFAELGAATPSSAILASNTSALPISAMSEASGRPDRVLGLHFFHPAPVMKLVEVIPTVRTSQDTLDTAVSFVEGIRKLPVRVRECAGFLVNRLLMPYVGEAIRGVESGAASKKEVDEAMVAFGMPVGPFLLVDTLGLDVCTKVAVVLEHAYGERAKPPASLKKLVDQGRLGMKSGAGFYSYSEAPEFAVGPEAPQGTFRPERLLFPMVNEAAFCLEEQVASPGDIDLAMMAGTGFPQRTQGPLHYADSEGLDVVLSKLKEAGHAPCPLLERKVAAGELGVKTKRGFFEYT